MEHMNKITAQDLRDKITHIISQTIEIHRGSRAVKDLKYFEPSGLPTEDEIDDFIVSNALFDMETVEQLLDPGFLGFSAKRAQVTKEWLNEFEGQVSSRSQSNSWLAADAPIWNIITTPPNPIESREWQPPNIKPLWLESSQSYILLAKEILRKGKLLSELSWRDFEKLVGALLETEGWNVEVAKETRDGGLDIIAVKDDPTLGLIQSAWQAKKYAPHRKVRLSEVRELSAVRDNIKATKGIMVTTSHLTRDAIEWIKQDKYRLSYKEQDDILNWIKGKHFG